MPDLTFRTQRDEDLYNEFNDLFKTLLTQPFTLHYENNDSYILYGIPNDQDLILRISDELDSYGATHIEYPMSMSSLSCISFKTHKVTYQ